MVDVGEPRRSHAGRFEHSRRDVDGGHRLRTQRELAGEGARAAADLEGCVHHGRSVPIQFRQPGDPVELRADLWSPLHDAASEDSHRLGSDFDHITELGTAGPDPVLGLDSLREGPAQPAERAPAPVAGSRSPGSVLGAQTGDNRDIRPAVPCLGLADGLVQKGEAAGASVTHRRLGDRNSEGKEPVLFVEETADVEPVVFRRAEFRWCPLLGRMAARRLGPGRRCSIEEETDPEDARRTDRSEPPMAPT
jgi:hypothetical protein